MPQSLDQQDLSMQSHEDEGLSVELAASLARESSLGHAFEMTTHYAKAVLNTFHSV